MGDSFYSSASYDAMLKKRKATTGVKAFSHNNNIRTGRVAAKVHDRVDPKNIKTVRESRDSDNHPNSNAIAVFFDVTASMGEIPVTLQKKLGKLMSTLLTKGVIDDPQILFGAVGDYTCDRVPFQIGQFESSEVMDEDLDKFYLEGGGGGQFQESYDAALFFLSRMTSIDCLEKRGKRGYAFLIGDEEGRTLNAKSIRKIFGNDVPVQDNMTMEELVAEAQKKYEIFFIIPSQSGMYKADKSKPYWNKLFGQNVLELDDPDLVCELIVSTIGIAEGVINDPTAYASDLGLTSSGKKSVNLALTPYVASKNSALATVEGGVLATTTSDDLGVL